MLASEELAVRTSSSSDATGGGSERRRSEGYSPQFFGRNGVVGSEPAAFRGLVSEAGAGVYAGQGHQAVEAALDGAAADA